MSALPEPWIPAPSHGLDEPQPLSVTMLDSAYAVEEASVCAPLFHWKIQKSYEMEPFTIVNDASLPAEGKAPAGTWMFNVALGHPHEPVACTVTSGSLFEPK